MSRNLVTILLLVSSFAVYYLGISPMYSGEGSIWRPSNGLKQLIDLKKQYEETVNEAKQLSSKAQSLTSEYNNVSDDDKEILKVMIPNEIDPVRLLSEINGIANDAGVVFKDLSYSDKSGQGDNMGGAKNMMQNSTTPSVSPTVMPGSPSTSVGAVPGSSQTGAGTLPQGSGSSQVTSSPKKSVDLGIYEISFTTSTTYDKFKQLMSKYENSMRLITIREVTFGEPDKKSGLVEYKVKLETYYMK